MSTDDDADDRSTLLRGLPKVDVVARDSVLAGVPHALAVGAARQVIDEVRADVRAGRCERLPDVAGLAAERARILGEGRLVSVINATGVVVHTNLGRAPWSPAARAAANRAMGYCDVELDRVTGLRGGRLSGLGAQIRHLTGAEAALVVNNCAAAVLLVLTALAAGREVVVSRGELVEIGGSFRVPDVIASGGARLREVGTTNRTRTADYARAIGPDTALLLRVHPSNFRVVGFTEEAPREALVALGRERGVPVVEDLGSGRLCPLGDADGGEPSVREVVEAGVDLVCFSGDKLLGGPQAGVIVGSAARIAALRAHPLYRALRVDKVTLAALEATLGDHASGRAPPVPAMLTEPVEAVRGRAERLAASLRGLGCPCELVDTPAVAGGGALPGRALASVAVRVAVARPDLAASALRLGTPAVVARVEGGAVVLDARTVDERDLDTLAARAAAATEAARVA